MCNRVVENIGFALYYSFQFRGLVPKFEFFWIKIEVEEVFQSLDGMYYEECKLFTRSGIGFAQDCLQIGGLKNKVLIYRNGKSSEMFIYLMNIVPYQVPTKKYKCVIDHHRFSGGTTLMCKLEELLAVGRCGGIHLLVFHR